MSCLCWFVRVGFTKADLKVTSKGEQGPYTKRDRIEQVVEKKIQGIVNTAKASHSKWEDPDFGPNENDPYGKISLYGSEPPAPAGTNKYPTPESMRWDRPQYADSNFGAEEKESEEAEEAYDEFADDFGMAAGGENTTLCEEGALFIGGSSSGDVIQGKLGDCWFLGALAVMGTKQGLLEKCFWRCDAFKEFGIFVCVFYKDCSLVYVVIDDRIPVFDSNGSVVFGKCKDRNELWVPLIEKAYAKLHGCYKALIGGYVHFGLADLTGYSPRLVGLKEGYMGYSDSLSKDEIWDMLTRYTEWGCLMGCSIQAAAKEEHKAEADVGDGLKMGHAYSLLDVGVISVEGKEVKLVKCRNPWGFGEWTGLWGDTSEIRTAYDEAICKVFNKQKTEEVEVRGNDGTFFMAFEDWVERFTSLFVAVNFPESWHGSMAIGKWTGDCGGPREMSTWVGNPKLKLTLAADPSDPDGAQAKQIFLGLYINDPRLVMGKEYYKDDLYRTAIGFDIVTENDVSVRVSKPKEGADDITADDITGSAHVGKRLGDPESKRTKQPPYMYGSTQVETMLKVGQDYFVVPSLRNRKQSGVYYLHAYSSAPFHLEGGVRTSIEKESKQLSVGTRQTSMTTVQLSEMKEGFREKLLAEAKRLSLTEKDMKAMFVKGPILRTALKRKMMDAGFNLADFPDEDFALLDADNSGAIDSDELLQFIGSGLSLTDPTKLPSLPTESPDDLLYQPVDLEGELKVNVCMAKSVRMPKTWFGVLDAADAASEANEVAPAGTKTESVIPIKYDICVVFCIFTSST